MRQPRLPSQSSFDMNVSMAREEGKAGFVAYYRSVRDFGFWAKIIRSTISVSLRNQPFKDTI